MEYEKFIKREPELEDFNIFLVNILREGRLVHSGLIDNRSDLDSRMDDFLIEAMKKEGFKTVVNVEHLHATWDYFFDPDNKRRIDEKYRHPFSGEFIRYIDSENVTGKRNSFDPWEYMGKDWIVYVHEEENRKGYNAAVDQHAIDQENLLNEFKEALFKEFGLEEISNREKIWQKAIGKFGASHPDQLEKVRDFIGDVADVT